MPFSAYDEGGGQTESQEGACESLKGPIALAVLFWFLQWVLFYKNNYVRYTKTRFVYRTT